MKSRMIRLPSLPGLAAAAALAIGVLLFGGMSVSATEVDVQFERAPVHEVFRVLAEAEGISLIIDQDVVGEITMSARGLTARQAMELVAGVRGLYLEQVGNTLVVSSEPKGLTQRMGETERSELKFTQRPVRDVVEALAARAGWNLISEAPLDREVTAWLEGMDYVDALRLVASAAGLHYQLVDRVLHIKGTIADEQQEERVVIHRLDHVNPTKAKELIEVFVPGATVEVDVATRSLVASGPTVRLDEVTAFLQEFDIARPQVLVEARILEVAVDALDSLGLEWSQLPTLIGSGTPAAWALTWDPTQFQITLRDLTERGRSKVLASPKISAVDGEAARMLIGDRVPIVTDHTDSDGRVTQTVEYIDVGIVLEIEPTIASDDTVTLDIRTEVSSVADPTSRFPTVRTREAESRVRVEDGRPLIIGGLIQEEEHERMSGIPYLSELPLLGSLFGRRVNENVQTETIIILIPHVVTDGKGPVAGVESSESASGRTASEASPRANVGTHFEANPAADRGLTSPAPFVDTTDSILDSFETPVLARGERVRTRNSVSIDLSALVDRATEIQLERTTGRTGFITRLYGGWDSDEMAWSLGTGVRLYGSDRSDEAARASVRAWIDGVTEYAVPLNDEPQFVFTAGAGLSLLMGDRGLLEFYARHQEPVKPGVLLGLPGRTETQLLGVKLGWQY